MRVARFETLPADILLAILSLLPGSSIRQCLQVCHLLASLICSSDCLGYLLELDACGYIRPDRIRTELSYGEMIELLREHRAWWDNPQSVVPMYYELPPNNLIGSRPFNKGVFTTAAKRDDMLIDQIHFYQLPSNNKGTSFEHWRIDLEVLFRDFLIDPEQDLLVGLELTHTPTSTSKVHLRSMRANNDHPKSLSGQFVLARPIFDEFDFSSMDIIGHSLAILGWSWLDGDFHAEIWDWTTGQQLSYLDLSDINAFSAQLLSEDSFVICQSAPFSSASSALFPEDALGCLNVYQFGLHSTTPMEAVHVGSFALPPDKNAGLGYRPAPATSTRSHGCSLAKIYNLESQDRLICADISTRRNRTPFLGSLCTPASTLLDALLSPGSRRVNHPSRTFIPWADWAGKAFWIPRDGSNIGTNIRFFGQRSASLGDGRNLTIVDFRKRRQTAWDIDSQDISDLMRNQKGAIQTSCRTERGRVAGKYPKATWDPSRAGQSTCVEMDDEHVIVLKKNVEPDGGDRLLVYSF